MQDAASTARDLQCQRADAASSSCCNFRKNLRFNLWSFTQACQSRHTNEPSTDERENFPLDFGRHGFAGDTVHQGEARNSGGNREYQGDGKTQSR